MDIRSIKKLYYEEGDLSVSQELIKHYERKNKIHKAINLATESKNNRIAKKLAYDYVLCKCPYRIILYFTDNLYTDTNYIGAHILFTYIHTFSKIEYVSEGINPIDITFNNLRLLAWNLVYYHVYSKLKYSPFLHTCISELYTIKILIKKNKIKEYNGYFIVPTPEISNLISILLSDLTDIQVLAKTVKTVKLWNSDFKDIYSDLLFLGELRIAY
jgi:hypothetical protein